MRPPKKKRRKVSRKALWRLTRRSLINPNESPKTQAFSVAIATFLAFVPLYGLQTILGILVAFALRLNKVLVIVLINIITPYPLVPVIMYLSFKIGGIFMEHPAQIDAGQSFSWQLLQNNLVQYLSGGLILAIVMALLLGALSYPLFILLQKKARLKN
ncbi:MAG: DUF2062 domain-containing protein [Bacteroidota bacterium]